ncbi:MAG: alpha-amylase family glycosyl hydrolase [Kiritimatiellae bacterium]|nr:alpha-amylase family glycosyl hydrolase [Kiritimatiellia bacterium]
MKKLMLTMALAAMTAQAADKYNPEAREAPEWLTKGVIYQIQPRAFTPEGTLKAATAKLKHIKELGATIIYICPVVVSDDDMDESLWSPRQRRSKTGNPRNNYRLKDYFNIDPEYGTREDFAGFVKTAHDLGLRVMLDLVFLHCGPTAVFLDKHPEYVKHDAEGKIVKSPWGFPAFNFESPACREYLMSIMTYWAAAFDIDGYRCDVAEMTPLDFWEKARERLDALRPGNFAMLCEGNCTGKGHELEQVNAFDCCYCFEWSNQVLFPVLDGKSPVSELRRVWLRLEAVLPKGARLLRYTDNHDCATDDGDKRRDHEKHWGVPLHDAALAFCFALDGVPFIYNGQEFADIRPHSMFTNKQGIDWSDASTSAAKARTALLKKFCALKASDDAFASGTLTWIDNDRPDAVASFIRTAPDGKRYLCVFNFRKDCKGVQVELPATPADTLVSANATVSAGGAYTFTGPAYDIRLLK